MAARLPARAADLARGYEQVGSPIPLGVLGDRLGMPLLRQDLAGSSTTAEPRLLG